MKSQTYPRLGDVAAKVLRPIVFLFAFAQLANADLLIAVDEWGKGYACTYTTGLAGYPGCASSGIAGMASFLRLSSALTTDPSSGFSNVLTYTVPGVNLAGLGTINGFDAAEGKVADQVNFSGNQIYVYSLQSFPVFGSCATQLNIGVNSATGCDGVADVPALPGGVGTLLQEIGPEGDNDIILFSAPGFTFIYQSDELTACPPIVPNCGPGNIAPPPNNPYRDIIAGGGIVVLPVGFNNNPLDVLTPEPSSFWLTMGAFGLLFANRLRRF